MKKTKQQTGPGVMRTYEEEIEFTCPVRGKVKQLVKVTRLQAVDASLPEEVFTGNSLPEKLDAKYSGLFIADDSIDEEPKDG
jgi:hypothetical protein